MKEKTKNRIISLVLVCTFLSLSLATGFISFNLQCEDIRQNVLRLHIIASSDSDFDQQLKLKVRDALLSTGSKLFDGTVTVNDAEKIAREEISLLTETADRVILSNGADYKSKIEICKSYFPTRQYDNITLPAGEYTAVKVLLGEARGHNWWCVMFPPLCLGACEDKTKLDDVLNEKSVQIVQDYPKYEIKFKITEWYEAIKEKIRESR